MCILPYSHCWILKDRRGCTQVRAMILSFLKCQRLNLVLFLKFDFFKCTNVSKILKIHVRRKWKIMPNTLFSVLKNCIVFAFRLFNWSSWLSIVPDLFLLLGTSYYHSSKLSLISITSQHSPQIETSWDIPQCITKKDGV